MSKKFDLNKYWGVRITESHLDLAEMRLRLELFWTQSNAPQTARLIFQGILRCDFNASRVYSSEVVELISLSADRDGANYRVIGELSNYDFEIVCESIVDSNEGAERNVSMV